MLLIGKRALKESRVDNRLVQGRRRKLMSITARADPLGLPTTHSTTLDQACSHDWLTALASKRSSNLGSARKQDFSEHILGLLRAHSSRSSPLAPCVCNLRSQTMSSGIRHADNNDCSPCCCIAPYAGIGEEHELKALDSNDVFVSLSLHT